MHRLELNDTEFEEVKGILARYVADARVLLFGSRVTGGSKPHSDLDIAIDAGGPVSISTLGALQESFSDSSLPFRVDIVDLNLVSPSFQALILKQAVELKMK